MSLLNLPEPSKSDTFGSTSRRPNAPDALALLHDEAVITPLTVEVHGIATHQEDDLILASALSGKASYLVTGDGKLRKLATYEGVTILSPRAFL